MGVKFRMALKKVKNDNLINDDKEIINIEKELFEDIIKIQEKVKDNWK
jgi:hypothetical protein